jgi:hypothetical protein
MDEKASAVQIHIPQQLISDTIRAEIVRQIPNKEGFAQAVIRAAMEEKAPNAYGGYRSEGPTVFQKAISEMINAEAKQVFGEWIEQNRKAIRDALIKELTRSQAARVKEIAEKITGGMMAWHATVAIKGTDEDR